MRFAVRVFFRRLETAGLELVPPDGPLLFVLNHPNSLVDPVFLFILSPRPVSVLAKEPLFRMPILGRLVRAMGSIPVERRQDPGADLTRNRQTFARVRDHLARGGAVALFPEGISHSDPRLRPMRTGAARIALGVATNPPLRIQPVGLFYTEKERFRSAALVVFGDPLVVAPAPLDAEGEPPGQAVQLLTDRIAQALAEVTLQADQHDAHEFVARTERILASARRANDLSPRPELAEEFEFRRRLLSGYQVLQQRNPRLLERLRNRVRRYQERLEGTGLDPWDVPVGPFRAGRGLGKVGFFLLRFLLLLPLGVPGLVLHFVPYRLIGVLARRAAGPAGDILATAKLISAAVVFPASWLVAGILIGRWAGLGAGLLAFGLAPLSGYAALRLLETVHRAAGALRALGLGLLGRRRFVLLQLERKRLRDDIVRLAEELGV
jgi:1-acyl-sn-glycerol-3-phosphate acyltransferase